MSKTRRATWAAALPALTCAGLAATAALGHDCRVRDVAGYLRGSYEGDPRGNYCGRGARFGVHSSEENFSNPMYGTGGACPPIQ
jgi:hypothetical protein